MNIRKKINFGLLVLAVFVSINSYGQKQFELRGNVSAFHKYPVTGIKINTKKAKTSVVTDDKGNFVINCKNRDKINIEAVGFESVSRSVTSKKSFVEINMIVKEDVKKTELIVSNGFLKKDDLEYGWEHLANENYDYANYFDIYDLIGDRYKETVVERSSPIPKVSFRRSPDIPSSASLRAVFQVNEIIRNDLTIYEPTDIISIKLLKGANALRIAGREVAGVFVITLK